MSGYNRLWGSSPKRGDSFTVKRLLNRRLLSLGAMIALHTAAATQYSIDSWTVDNGLPQNIVRGICQTRDGYLWIATFDGLVRFDGVRFTVFSTNNTADIKSNRFTSLAYTPDGDFWAGTEASAVTRYHQGTFVTYNTKGVLPEGPTYVMAGKSGRVSVIAGGTLGEWNEQEGRFVLIEPGFEPVAYENARGCVKFEKATLRVYEDGKFSDYPLPRGWPSHSQGAQDLNGGIWISDVDGHLAKVIHGQLIEIHGERHKASTSAMDSGSVYEYRDEEGRTFQAAVGRDQHAWLNLPTRTGVKTLLINAFFRDREGNMWVGTDGQGLMRILPKAIHAYSLEEGLPNRLVYPIYQARDGTVWIGTWGGLASFSDGKITAYPTLPGVKSALFDSITEDQAGTLWFSTHFELVHKQGSVFQSVNDPALTGFYPFHAMYQDSKGRFWLGSGRGLLVHDGQRWARITAKDGLAGDDVRVILPGRAGNLWIGSYGGLSSFKDGRWTRWTEREGLPSSTIRALYEDGGGALWIGTYDGGLIRFEDGKFRQITVNQGLFNKGVFRILEDEHGYFWMSCNRGIYRVSKQQLNDVANGILKTVTSKSYGKGDGMSNEECNGGNQPAGIRARDGTLWFPTQDGVAVIDPKIPRSNMQPAPVRIEAVLSDREPLALNKPIQILPGRENLQIDYTALSFIDSEHLYFHYRMEGLDRDWVEAGARRMAWYSHIPPGDYTFRVNARTSEGVWNPMGQSIHLPVLPRFYQTWWFQATLLVLALGVGAAGWHYREAQVKRAQAQQEAFSRQLIDSQEAERQRIAAELHDSLGQTLLVIKNRANMALRSVRDPESTEEQLSEISASASDAVEEVRYIAHNLRPFNLDRFGLGRTLQAMFSETSRTSGILFELEVDPVDGLLSKEVEINLFRVVQEAANNMMKHSQATSGKFMMQRANYGVHVTIQDNGKGFDTAEAVANKRGFGLVGMAERIRLSGGTFAVRSTPQCGTTIEIHLPVRDENANV